MGIVVFISYATKDAEAFYIKWIAEQLRKKPKVDKVLIWEEDAHGSIIKYMEESVNECDVFLLFCSKNALHSDPMRTEWETAQYLKKKIIPIFTSTDHVPTLLKRLRGIRFRANDLRGTLDELYHEILKVLE